MNEWNKFSGLLLLGQKVGWTEPKGAFVILFNFYIRCHLKLIVKKHKAQVKTTNILWPSLGSHVYLLTKTFWLVSVALSWEGEVESDVAHWMLKTQPEGLQHNNYHLSSPLSALCLVWPRFKFIQDQKIRRIKQQRNLWAQAHTIQDFYSLGWNIHSWTPVEQTRRIKGFFYYI